MQKKTLRDEIAMSVAPKLVELIASGLLVIDQRHIGMSHQDIVGTEAYSIADALMKARG